MHTAANPVRVAWLIPEYPRQSHTFFHRELVALRRLGVDVKIYSTRLLKEPAQHSWAAQAIAETTYLHPPRVAGMLGALGTILKAGPRGWARVLRAIATAEVPGPRDRLRLGALVFYGAELAGFMRRDGRAHVHVQLCSDTAHVALFAKLLAGTSYSISHHEFLKEFGPNQKQKWENASFGHTISQVHLDELRTELHAAVPGEMVVAPMGIEPEKFVRSRPYEPWTGTGDFRIFSCGRLTMGKNQEALLRALALVRAAGIPATLTLAGSDESPGQFYLRRLEALITELSLGPYVTMLGQASEEVVREQLERAHVFALTSLHEGVPVVVMEAMAMELPVVVTDVGGMRDLVTDGREGILVQPGSAELVAHGLEKVARSPELACSVSQIARAKVLAGFHSGVSARALADLLTRNLRIPAAPRFRPEAEPG
jgi:colanic acid/amylovoran biosynthesis glycosyltransferase